MAAAWPQSLISLNISGCQNEDCPPIEDKIAFKRHGAYGSKVRGALFQNIHGASSDPEVT